jgi:ribosomal protein S12 methylthiotransferase accessory factor
MLNNSALVLEEFDHTLLAGLPEAKYRFDFLDSEPKPVKTVQELTVPEAEQWSLDSGIALKGIAEKLAAQGWDLIAVDQTPPEAKQIGLSVVRALIPGIVPFTLGHNYRRVATARIELPEDNELWPHPFA